MQIKIVLTLSEIEQALEDYARAQHQLDDYTSVEVQFDYDEPEGDDYRIIDGASVSFEKQQESE